MPRLIHLATILVAATLATVARGAEPTDGSREAVAATGITAGLCVHLGTSDGRLEADLARGGTMLVHGLAPDAASLEQARRTIRAAGLYGLASVERAAATAALPYADNLVNLLVADLDALGTRAPPREEMMRVLVPNGVACLRTGGTWTRLVKPRPKEMDDWTHFDYGPEGNGVSHDRLVRLPTGVQWMAGVQPITLGGNPAGFRVYTSPRVAGGRIFLEWGTYDEKKKHHQWYNGRDAFNGLPLWTVENTCPGRKDWQFVASADRLYTFVEKGGPLVALDARTGRVVQTYDAGGRHDPERSRTALRLCAGTLLETSGDTLWALDAASGALRWKHTQAGTNLFFPSATAAERKVFVAAAPEATRDSARWPVGELAAIVCLDLGTGQIVWRNTEVAGSHIGQLVYAGGNLALFGSGAIGGGDKPFIGNIRVRDGKLLWQATFKKEYNRFGYNLLVRDGTMYYADAWRVYAHDPATGEATVPFDDRGYNMRCNRFSATDDLFIFGLVAYIDRGWRGTFQSITRSGCAQGAIPANGMLYFTPNACHCITQLRGHIALSSESLRAPWPDDRRLEHGAAAPPAAPPPAPPTPPAAGPVADDWLHNVRAPDRETKPVLLGSAMVDEWVAVAVIHEHRIEARDTSGKAMWSFTAGGRISSPPVVAGGLVYFGSHDGWVYCVRADNGQLVWRFMAAPYERKIVACGQLESAWPVYGVVMHDGCVCASAGVHPEAGGGITVYGLDPKTGQPQWKKVLARSPVEYGGKGRVSIRPNRILNDVLQSDGQTLRLPGLEFRPDEPDADIQKKIDGQTEEKKKR